MDYGTGDSDGSADQLTFLGASTTCQAPPLLNPPASSSRSTENPFYRRTTLGQSVWRNPVNADGSVQDEVVGSAFLEDDIRKPRPCAVHHGEALGGNDMRSPLAIAASLFTFCLPPPFPPPPTTTAASSMRNFPTKLITASRWWPPFPLTSAKWPSQTLR